MRIEQFTEWKTGKLVPIDSVPDKQEWAFIPQPLPPRWEFPNRLWPLLAEAREAIAYLEGAGSVLPDPKLLIKPLQRREAICSSRLEGTYITAADLLLFEMRPKRKPETDQENDWLEVHNYTLALRRGVKQLEVEGRITVKGLLELHKILLRGVRGETKLPGELRPYQVHVGHERRYIPPPALELPGCLDAMEEYINDPSDSLAPLIRAYFVHYQFESIHPLVDGNGRVGRLLLALTTWKWTTLTRPWLYMSPFFEKNKEEYIDRLFRVSTHGEWEEWLIFCLNGTIQQANNARSRCTQLIDLRRKYFTELKRTSTRTHSIIERLFVTPVFTVVGLAKMINVTYPTAKSDIDLLVDVGILEELGEHRPKAYMAPEILRIAYQED